MSGRKIHYEGLQRPVLLHLSSSICQRWDTRGTSLEEPCV